MIHKLDQNTINQIAAGEVVERPSSVVKELVENSIDSGASAITVEIKDGGTTLLRITDNGSGIESGEVRTAFLRHATSKITGIEDLEQISSLGFRGEALASISAVAQVELITKIRSELTGVRYCIDGGEEKEFSEIGCPDGTTIIVRNLFFNTPARRKFLKSPVTEGSYIGEIMERLAISHPGISITLISNGKKLISTAGNGNVKDAIYHIYGRDITSNLLEISYDSDQISIKGYLCRPVVVRGNRNYENYFVNGRYIKNPIVSKAIEEAYKPYLMQHKFPFTVLEFTVPSTLVDVNVHPSKLEVRFSNQQEIYERIYKQVSETVKEKSLIQTMTLLNHKEEKQQSFEEKKITQDWINKKLDIPEPFEVARRREMGYADDQFQKTAINNEGINNEGTYNTGINNEGTYNAGTYNAGINNEGTYDEVTYNTGTNKPYADEQVMESFESEKSKWEGLSDFTKVPYEPEKNECDRTIQNSPKRTEDVLGLKIRPEQITFLTEEFLSEQAVVHHTIIGQLFLTYWLVEYNEQLYIIDQHAAHEKVLFERLMKEHEKGEVPSQRLSPPIIISLSLAEEATLLRYKEELQEFGYEIEDFGGREYAVSAIPSNLYGLNEQDMLMELIDLMTEEISNVPQNLLYEKIASMSCKAAVKGNSRMSVEEAKNLIHELLKLENPFHCPHGRPVIVSMTKQELERKFKRIV